MELTLSPEDAAFRDELNVGHYFKRISSINIQFGDPAYHVPRYAQLDAAA
jgi:hypothetical protein